MYILINVCKIISTHNYWKLKYKFACARKNEREAKALVARQDAHKKKEAERAEK